MRNRTIKLRRTIFIILEFISGFGFAILGSYLFSFFDKADLDASVLYTFIIGYTSMIIGTALIGYFHFKSTNRLKEFGKALVGSFIGLFLFLILYIWLELADFNLFPYYINSFILPIFLPLLGAVAGFNFIMFWEKKREYKP